MATTARHFIIQGSCPRSVPLPLAQANNFADADGNVRRGKYVDDGYLESDGDAPPSFFANLMSGGRLQREFTDRVAAASAPPKSKKSGRR